MLSHTFLPTWSNKQMKEWQGRSIAPLSASSPNKQLYELLEGLKMEEYTRKHLNESVYPFVYMPQNPLHFCIKEESEEERNRKCS